MNTDLSASNSGKTASRTATGSTPFDQITALEKEENKRFRTEVDAMDEEKKEVEQALKEKGEIGDQEMRDAARKELLEYRETELSTIMKTAEKEMTKETEKVENAVQAKEKDMAKKLLTQMVGNDSPLLQS